MSDNSWTPDTAPIVFEHGARVTAQIMQPAWERARACFKAAPTLKAIAVCAEVIGSGDFSERRMPVPFITWLGQSRKDFDFDAEVHINTDFAIHASRFQAAAVPRDGSNVVAVTISTGKTAFVSSILHFARSGQVRLLAGTFGEQMIRFIGEGRDVNPDLSNIRPVFNGEPTAHELIEAYGGITGDLRFFNISFKG